MANPSVKVSILPIDAPPILGDMCNAGFVKVSSVCDSKRNTFHAFVCESAPAECHATIRAIKLASFPTESAAIYAIEEHLREKGVLPTDSYHDPATVGLCYATIER
jgi:hypothetical protein